jgi:hypothetical protein
VGELCADESDEAVAEPLPLALPDAVALALLVADEEAEGERCGDDSDEAVAEPLPLALAAGDAVLLLLCAPEPLCAALPVGLPVALLLPVPVAEVAAETVAPVEASPVREPLSVAVGEAPDVGDPVSVSSAVSVGSTEAEEEADPVAVGVGELEGGAVGSAVTLPDEEEEEEAVGSSSKTRRWPAGCAAGITAGAETTARGSSEYNTNKVRANNGDIRRKPLGIQSLLAGCGIPGNRCQVEAHACTARPATGPPSRSRFPTQRWPPLSSRCP